MIKAVIFDMDGVLLDSMPMHLKVWEDIFEKRNIPFSLKIFEKYNGTSTIEIAKRIIEEFNLKDEPENIVKEKHDAEKILGKDLKLFPETISILKKLREMNYKIAIGTAAMGGTVEFVKEHFGLDKLVDVLVYSAEVEHSKPSPDIFLLAAKELNVKPEECVVVEDAIKGIEAARRAGMVSVAITNTFDKEAFVGVADHIIDNLDELTEKILVGERICAE
jgi:beta-phosphoglucomutase family hydrolase